ncbi:hypothetical protein ACSSS7_006580 [Eimeria intestinalis]
MGPRGAHPLKALLLDLARKRATASRILLWGRCRGETASDLAVSEVWSYEEGWETFVSTCGDSWRNWSLCGLPRLWSSRPSAALAAAAAAATPRTPDSSSNSSSSSSSKGHQRKSSKASTHTTVSQTWVVQQHGPHAAAESLCLDSSYLRAPTLPRTSAAAAAAAAVAAAAAEETLSAMRSKGSAAFDSCAGSPAAAAAARSCISSTPRGCTYTAVSRHSALVRYEPQTEGFDMAWVNAPMFLISIPPTAATAPAAPAATTTTTAGSGGTPAAGDAAAASGALQQSLEQQRGQLLLQQTEQPPVEMMLSVTQSCNLNVAPVSMAVFRARVSKIRSSTNPRY